MSDSIWNGDLVRLRSAEPDDAEFFRSMAQDSEAARMGSGVPLPRSPEEAKKQAKEQALRKPTDDNISWVVESLSGVPVGGISTHGARLEHGHFEYGINLAREHWGKGYAADALKILLRFMFQERRYQKVTAVVYAFNDQSRRMHENSASVTDDEERLGR